MARGFRGMKDDFMEIIDHIIRLSCCSVAHDDNDGLLLPLPQRTIGDFACLEVSQVLSASDTELRDAAATEDVPRSDLACTAQVDDDVSRLKPPQYKKLLKALAPQHPQCVDSKPPCIKAIGASKPCHRRIKVEGVPKLPASVLKPKDSVCCAGTGPSSPKAEYVAIDEGLDPGFAAVRNTLCPTFGSEENFWRGCNASLNIKLHVKDCELLPSSQIEEEKNLSPNILETKSSFRPLNYIMGSNEMEEAFGSASHIEDYYIYSKNEGENVSILKHILVEDHMPSIALSEGLQLRKRTNKNLDDEDTGDYHQADGFDYVIV